jgi:hypothetical protein
VELQRHYDVLRESYTSLELECASVKRDLENLRRDKGMYGGVSPATRSCQAGYMELKEFRNQTSNPVQFNRFASYFGGEEEGGQPLTHGYPPHHSQLQSCC